MSAPSVPAAPTAMTAAATVDSLRRVLRNAAALLGAYVLPRALTFAAALVAARVLGPARFGVYGAAASFAIILSIIATLGMLPLLVRELARRPEQAAALLAAARRIKLIASAVMLAAVVSAGAFLLRFPPELTLSASVLALGYACWSLAENGGAWYQAQERMHVWFRANVIFGVVAGTLGMVLVLLTHSVIAFCAAFAAAQLAAWLWLRRRLPSPVGVPAAAVRWLARATAPFAFAFLMLTIFYKFDVLLLQRLQPAAVTGVYAAGYKLIDVVHALAVIAAGALYPRLSRAAVDPSRAFVQHGTRTIELFLLAAVPAAALLWLLRAPVTLLLFGTAYADTAHVLGLLAPALCALVVNILAGYLLSVQDRVVLLGVCYAAATLVKLLLGLWWIPLFGATDAADAMLCAEFGLAILLLGALARAGAGVPRARALSLAALGMAAAAACGIMLAAHPVAGALLFACLLALLYALGGALTIPEQRALRGVLRRA